MHYHYPQADIVYQPKIQALENTHRKGQLNVGRFRAGRGICMVIKDGRVGVQAKPRDVSGPELHEGSGVTFIPLRQRIVESSGVLRYQLQGLVEVDRPAR